MRVQLERVWAGVDGDRDWANFGDRFLHRVLVLPRQDGPVGDVNDGVLGTIVAFVLLRREK